MERKQEFASLQSQENFLWLQVDVLFPPKRTGCEAFQGKDFFVPNAMNSTQNGGILISVFFCIFALEFLQSKQGHREGQHSKQESVGTHKDLT